MKVSYNWLKEYVDFDYSPAELAKELTLAGLEVDKIETQGEAIAEIEVGLIKEINEHQNADKLLVCQVDVGDENLQIVCGANNIKAGDKVPVARVGTVMPNGMEIKETKLRGVLSKGMLCSTDELNLPDDGVDGIYILSDDLTVGNKLVKELELDDIILEIDLTPNYSHALSMLGVAREVSALTGKQLKIPEANIEETSEKIADWINIEIADSKLCPRYAGRVITGVEVGESPQWLKNRLEAVGVRSVNNVVDITNYVLMELGQPLHAFDYEQIAGNQIKIRKAKADETLLTLDDEQRKLDNDMLVIADKDDPICLAGVMGGLESEVDDDTVTVFLESANFNPGTVRSTAKKLGIHSDASHRFERGVDIELVTLALNRATELIVDICNGYVIKGIEDVYPVEKEEKNIALRPERVNKLLGTDLAKIEIKNLLEDLHFNVLDSGAKLDVEIPTYRVDVDQEVDLIEEVARSYGYDKIEISNPTGEMQQGKKTKEQKINDKSKEVLSLLGLYEAQNYSFISYDELDAIEIPPNHSLRNVVELGNPLNEDYKILRPTLIPSLLKNIRHNINRNNEEVEIFELSRAFTSVEGEKLPQESLRLSAAVINPDSEDLWETGAKEFFYLKGILEDYLKILGIKEVEFNKGEEFYLHPGRTAEIIINGDSCGYLGELHPDVQDNYDFEAKVATFDIDFRTIADNARFIKDYKPLPKYPALNRDLAIVVDNSISNKEIKEVIYNTAGDRLESLELFDLYRGEQVPEDKKSMAYSLSYRTKDKTLTDEEVNRIQVSIQEELNNKLEAEIRDK